MPRIVGKPFCSPRRRPLSRGVRHSYFYGADDGPPGVVCRAGRAALLNNDLGAELIRAEPLRAALRAGLKNLNRTLSGVSA